MQDGIDVQTPKQYFAGNSGRRNESLEATKELRNAKRLDC